MTRAFRCCCVAVGASLALPACGGGGGSMVPAGPSQGKSAAYASAALSFFVSSASTSHVRTKRPAYLPSTTQSIVVNVFNADGSPTTPPFSPTATNVGSGSCTSVSGGQQCTITVTVPSGTLLFAIAAYAQPNGAGALLSSSTTTATIGSGPNNVSVSLSPQTQYVGTNLDGGGMQSVMIDHQARTFHVANNSGTTATSGTFTSLPNGDLKAMVTAATDGTSIGSIAYIREIANGALMFAATDTPTPSAEGSSSTADFGMMTAVQSCPNASTTFPINVIGVAGPNFPNVVSTHEAYDVGTASVASGTLTFTGNSYVLSGTNLGPASVQPETCANGIFNDSSGGSVTYDPAGFLVVASGSNQGTAPSITGNFGLRAPSQPLDLSAIASQKYEAYEGAFSNAQGSSKLEVPIAMAPGGSNSLTGCTYSNFEANSVGTNCGTITFKAQPFPGLVTGTVTGSTSTTPFVAAVGQVNGKYVIVLLSVDQTQGQAVNLALMQQ